MLVPYVVLAVTSAFYLQSRRIGTFRRRFVPCLVAYIVATAIVIIYIDTVVRPHIGNMTFAGFLLPLVYMVVLGAAGSAVVAAIAGRRNTTP
jgi:hypothetical protein